MMRKRILEELPDATAILNTIVNDRIALAVRAANKKSSCNGKELERQVLRHISGRPLPMVVGGKVSLVYGYFGYFEPLVEKGTDSKGQYRVPSLRQKRKDSVYRNLTGTAAVPFDHMGSLVRIGDLVIGSDKFGHFMGQGYEYYLVGSTENGLARGDLLERGVLGFGSTGVYSYGDLSANFGGSLFYKNLYGSPNAHVLCQDNAFIPNPNKPFRWEDFVTPAWDEGINCSGYKSAKVKATIDKTIREEEEKQGIALACPLTKEQCKKAIATVLQRYGKAVTRATISPACFASVLLD